MEGLTGVQEQGKYRRGLPRNLGGLAGSIPEANVQGDTRRKLPAGSLKCTMAIMNCKSGHK